MMNTWDPFNKFGTNNTQGVGISPVIFYVKYPITFLSVSYVSYGKNSDDS